MDLQKWLSDPDRDYATGVALYKEYNGMDLYYNFFNQVDNANPKSQHFKMLVKRLERTRRIAIQNGTLNKPANVETPKAEPKEIKVQTIVSSEETSGTNVDDLRENHKYVNKILALQWRDLEARDKAVFFNNESYFDKKKELFVKNSDNEKELKSKHALLKHEKVKGERSKILEEGK